MGEGGDEVTEIKKAQRWLLRAQGKFREETEMIVKMQHSKS